MATPLERSDLLSLEDYASQRDAFRVRVIAHKKPRRVGIGPNLFLYFEDRLTMQYQVQEMLRIERIFEAEGIAEELDAYNPLIPDGTGFHPVCVCCGADVPPAEGATTRTGRSTPASSINADTKASNCWASTLSSSEALRYASPR